MNSFTLGGIAVPLHARLKFNQSYESKRVSTDHAMGDGSTERQTLAGTADKLRTTLSGFGWSPLGLNGLDYTGSLVLKCVEPLIITSASNVITIPAARRSDAGYTPVGFAIVDDLQVSTTINIVDNIATLGTVSGATGYQAQYVPEITVYASFKESLASETASYNWSLTCEEI